VTLDGDIASDTTAARRGGLVLAGQRALVHLLLGTRPWAYRHIKRIAADTAGKRVLEIGSGGAGRSAKALFEAENEFVQSDVAPDFGHLVVDVTTMEFESEFDLVLCVYVLEHVYDVRQAMERIHHALVPGGRAFVVVPTIYPYHDEPTDYWRFTEYSLRELLRPFGTVVIRHRGLRRLPLALLAEATK
jgi:2-polyprenyl-3-methyl-5-hydroxy-6-metoxy-1,4-benzoquinol methylase